jgi:hypothetical protein
MQRVAMPETQTERLYRRAPDITAQASVPGCFTGD